MGALGNRLLAQDAAAGALPALYSAVADLPGNTFAARPASGTARHPPVCAPPPRKRATTRRPAASGTRQQP